MTERRRAGPSEEPARCRIHSFRVAASALAPADRAGLRGAQGAPAAGWAILHRLEHSEQLADAAHEQTFLVNLDPRPRRGREHHMIPSLDGHPHADVVPPVKAGADCEHDPVLWRRLVGARRHDQPGAPHAVGIKLLDHDPIEQRAQLITHFSDRRAVGGRTSSGDSRGPMAGVYGMNTMRLPGGHGAFQAVSTWSSGIGTASTV